MKQQEQPRCQTPQIELHGNLLAVVGDCEGILEYEPETVKLRAGKRFVRICGRGLNLCNLTEASVMVRGIIDSVEFEG